MSKKSVPQAAAAAAATALAAAVPAAAASSDLNARATQQRFPLVIALG